MLSVQQQLAKRRLDEERKFKKSRREELEKRLNASNKSFLSEAFSKWREYKRFYEQISVIQRFMSSFRYIIKMRILKKNHREPDSATHSSYETDRFIILEQNREAGIGMSRDLKNEQSTRIRAFLIGFVKTHSPLVNECVFIQKLREILSRDEFDTIKPDYRQTFIQFFESARKTREESRNGCATMIRKNQLYGIDLLWILYYLSSDRLPKNWFPNKESDFAFVYEELKLFIGRMNQTEEEEPLEQLDYCPELCRLCGLEIIQGTCYNMECMRRREYACASCGNSILEGSNIVEVDGMRLHPDCANHNQHNSHFSNYTECSACGCSSNDMSFIEGIGLVCDRCISLNQ